MPQELSSHPDPERSEGEGGMIQVMPPSLRSGEGRRDPAGLVRGTPGDYNVITQGKEIR